MPTTSVIKKKQTIEEITTTGGAIIVELRSAIQETEDPLRLQELLGVNDELVSLLKQSMSLGGGGEGVGNVGAVGGRPKLVLQGLGLSLDGNSDGNGNEAKPLLKIEESDDDANVPDPPDVGVGAVDTSANGVVGQGAPAEGVKQGEDEEEPIPTTPRIDKGKGRAEPEEEEPEKVLSPSYVIDSEDEDEEGGRYDIPEEIAALMPSPTERYVVAFEFQAQGAAFDLCLVMHTGREVGSQRRERYSGREQCSLGRKSWRASMRARSCAKRCALSYSFHCPLDSPARIATRSNG